MRKYFFNIIFYISIIIIFFIDVVYPYDPVGYDDILLGDKLNVVENYLFINKIKYNLFNTGYVNVISFFDKKQHIEGMLIFNLVNRLNSILISIQCNHDEFNKLFEHMKKKYGDPENNNSLFKLWNFYNYKIELNYSKKNKLATVVYSYKNKIIIPATSDNKYSKF